MMESRHSISSLEDEDPTCQLITDRPPSSASSRTTFTIEDVNLMTDTELDELCRQVFAMCDANGDGFITAEELMIHCSEDDPELLQHLMTTMDIDKDGRISFEEFRSGLDTVTQHLDIIHSTPDNTRADRHVVESLYENEPVTDEKEEAWLITMERIDPNGYICNNKELRSVWIDLLSKDSNLLDKFEIFLANIVEELDKSHSDVEQIERRMKQVLTNHSKEVSEMDGVMDQRLQEAFVEQEVKSQQQSDKLNDQYRHLLEERDQLIATLALQEVTLQHKLTEKVQSEQELRKERLHLLHLNKSLQDQLSDSYLILSASQREIKRLSFYERDEEGGVVIGRGMACIDPLIEASITSEYTTPSECDQSVCSSQPMLTLSPPPEPSISSPFNSPSLAIEVAQALQQDGYRGDVTPTPSSATPTELEDQERMRLLESSDEVGVVNGYVGVVSPNSSGSSQGYVLVERQGSPPPKATPTFISVPAPSSQYQTTPSSTPVNMVYSDPTPFTVSTIIREERNAPLPPSDKQQLVMPSRVFKVVFLGDSGVGKTSLIRRLTSGQFGTSPSTLGLDYNTCVVTVGEERVAFQLWDTAGQERFQSTTAVYFKRADAFVVVYDVSNKQSFKSIKSWISLVKTTVRGDLPLIMLMGNKTDKDQLRNVSKEDGRSLALELRAMFSETSALSGANVLQAHCTLASLLLERENRDIEEIKRSALRLNTLQEKKRCKC